MSLKELRDQYAEAVDRPELIKAEIKRVIDELNRTATVQAVEKCFKLTTKEGKYEEVEKKMEVHFNL